MIGKPPIECKALAVSVHRGFDVIALDAEKIDMPSHTLGQLSDVLRKCAGVYHHQPDAFAQTQRGGGGGEPEERSRLLRLLSYDEMQGFLFSRPVPAEIFETKFLAPPWSPPA